MRALISVQLPETEDNKYINEVEIDNIFRFMRIFPKKLLSREEFKQLSEPKKIALLNNNPKEQSNNPESVQPTEQDSAMGLLITTDNEYDNYRPKFCQELAKPILERMPKNTEDEKRKLEQAKESVICASRLPVSYAECAAFIETEGALLFRIHNPKTDNLRKGCEEVVMRIQAYNQKQKKYQLILGDEIEIYEHGLEIPTITGTIILSKWKALYNRTSVHRF